MNDTPKLIRTVPPLEPANEAFYREVSEREGWLVLPHKDLRSLLEEIDRLRALTQAPPPAPFAVPTGALGLEDLLS